MLLRDLAKILPGYVTVAFHTADQGWNMTAAVLANNEELSQAQVIKATPIAPYIMEVSIEFKEEDK